MKADRLFYSPTIQRHTAAVHYLFEYLSIRSVWIVLLLLGCGGREPVRDIPPPIMGPDGTLATTVDFRLSTIDGDEIQLSQYRGRVVLVNYFATWCGPCISALPLLNSLVDGPNKLADFEVLAINVELQARQLLPHFLDFMPVKSPVLLADEGTKTGHTPFGRLTGIPASYLVDPDGRHVETFVGVLPLEYLRRKVRALNGAD